MDLHDALRTRRTIQRFARGEVPRDTIERALAAAHLAPNHRHTWPWRFLVVGREMRAALAEVAVGLKTRPDEPLRDEVADAIREKVLAPAWLIVVRRVRHEDPVTEREDYAAIACAIQNLQLSLHGDGIGAKWGTGRLTKHEATYAHLGIDETVEEIEGFLWVGHPRDEHKTPARPPLDDHVAWLP